MLDSLIAIVVQRPELAGALVAGLAGTAAHYSKTGRLPIGRLPLRALRNAWGELAERYFGKPRPRGVPALVVSTDVDGLDSSLRDEHFEGADDTSLEYEGEVLNLRRPSGTMPHPESGETVPTETHVRAFKTKSGDLLVLTHGEASRFEAWAAHWHRAVFSWERGRDDLAEELEDLELDFERIESERAAGVEVV